MRVKWAPLNLWYTTYIYVVIHCHPFRQNFYVYKKRLFARRAINHTRIYFTPFLATKSYNKHIVTGKPSGKI